MLSHDLLLRASQLFHDNKLVAFPTETVYGLGANALSDEAVASIYAAKNRPDFNPLIVHVLSMDEAKKYAEFNEAAEKLGRHFWPGPLTLVLSRLKNCPLSLLVSAGMDTVALRVPAHSAAQALLQQCQLPIAAPSANRSGRISPTTAQHVEEEMAGRVDLIVNGGACDVGIESTVVSLVGIPKILRPGSVSAESLSQVLGAKIIHDATGGMHSPGMLASHYAPNNRVRLNATNVAADEALLAFGSNTPKGAAHTANLSPRGDLKEAAANLFRMLRALDETNASCIAVMPIPDEGPENALGIAINDRLVRAASPRPHQAP